VIIRATCVEYIGLICKSNFRKSMVHQCKVVIASEEKLVSGFCEVGGKNSLKIAGK